MCVLVFGLRRIRRRRTPYVDVQTAVLMAIQVLPLFLLPEILLPWLGRNGWLDGGPLGWLADQLFPRHAAGSAEREYWRAYGLVLAWPLMVYNWFTAQPIWGWLVLGFVQTFVLIPALVWRWGKGAYCGWICSCGALAETMGDDHRHKMPHGPGWNRLNLLGQAILALAALMMLVRIAGWVLPAGGAVDGAVEALFARLAGGYQAVIDVVLAGILGVGLYFHFSGRTWCRFACPLAALMHVYARFSRFRILADKHKCISCNACTAVCHQGIDVMGFANKGLPMADPQCVRCSACVQTCPTGVLAFGQVEPASGRVVRVDRLAASPVRMAEAAAGADAGSGHDRHGRRRAWLKVAAVTLGFLLVGGALLAAQVRVRAAGAGKPASPPATAPATRPATAPATAPANAAAPREPATAPTASATDRPAAAGRFDHGAFDAILAATVADERVDYRAIRDRHLAALDAYLDRLAAADPASLDRAEQLAFHVNLYNATMIRAVVDRYRPGWSPADRDHAVFRAPLVRLASRTVSLDQLEKEILLPTFREPRLHAALVCAAVSCPPILARAYRGDDLEAVLEANLRRFVNDPRRNRVDHARRRLELSAIFDWYAGDFGGPQAIPAYVARYLDGPDPSGYRVSFLPYDWTLNDRR